jgi:cytochrome bd-type quinol oxidase subunit 2
MAWWKNAAADVEIKRQLVTLAAVTALVVGVETVVFFAWMAPAHRRDIQAALAKQRVVPKISPDPVLGAYLEVLDRREHELTERCNRATILYAVLIVAVPCLVVAGLYATSGPLRTTDQRRMLLDVALVSGGSVGFLIYFTAFTRHWQHPSVDQLAFDVASDYLTAATGGDGAAWR